MDDRYYDRPKSKKKKCDFVDTLRELASIPESFLFVQAIKKPHFSHPLDKNIPFYRYMRFFYPVTLTFDLGTCPYT